MYQTKKGYSATKKNNGTFGETRFKSCTRATQTLINYLYLNLILASVEVVLQDSRILSYSEVCFVEYAWVLYAAYFFKYIFLSFSFHFPLLLLFHIFHR